MATFQPHLDASRVDRLLKQSLAELKRAEKNAVLWFGEVLKRKLYRELGCSSIHQYAALELGFSKTRTAQFIRLAESLHTLPKLRRSLARGDVSWTKAREVARVATPKTETAWIDHARRSTSRELERKVAETKRTARSLRNGSAAQGVLVEANGVAVPGAAPAGTAASPPVAPPPSLAAEVPVGLQLRFTPAQYARYEALMEKLRKQGGCGSREELVLAAMEAAVLAGASNGKEIDPAHPSDKKAERVPGSAREAAPKTTGPEAQIEHNAFPRGNPPSPHATAPSPHETPSSPRGTPPSPYQVVVRVCERCEASAVETGRGTLALAPQTLKAILCDAKVRRRGERNRSAIPARVRRGVLERDRFRCRGAGCGNTRFLSVHHLVPREAGGSNAPENLVTLCEGCHRATHRHGA